MHSLHLLGTALGGVALTSGALAEPIPAKARPLEPRQTIIPGGAACGEHGPDNRRCWKNNWTIDKENEIDPPPALVSGRTPPLRPVRGLRLGGTDSNSCAQNTREYDFYVTNETDWVGPDGVPKPAMLVNGQLPRSRAFSHLALCIVPSLPLAISSKSRAAGGLSPC